MASRAKHPLLWLIMVAFVAVVPCAVPAAAETYRTTVSVTNNTAWRVEFYYYDLFEETDYFIVHASSSNSHIVAHEGILYNYAVGYDAAGDVAKNWDNNGGWCESDVGSLNSVSFTLSAGDVEHSCPAVSAPW